MILGGAMNKTIYVAFILLAMMLASAAVNGQEPPATPATSAQDTLREEIELLKKQVKALEARLTAEEAKIQTAVVQDSDEQRAAVEKIAEEQAQTAQQVKEINRRVMKTERDTALQRIRFSGDYRFEAHSIRATQPARYDGMKFQNLLVKSMFAMNVLGRPPMSVNEINQTVAGNYGDYQYFTSALTFDQLKTAMGNFPADLSSNCSDFFNLKRSYRNRRRTTVFSLQTESESIWIQRSRMI